MEFVNEGLVRLKVKNRWRVCLKYTCINKYGEVFEGGLITLDKKWMKPCATPDIPSVWTQIFYRVKDNRYEFPDPHGGPKPYSVFEQLIDMVDTTILEHHLIGESETSSL